MQDRAGHELYYYCRIQVPVIDRRDSPNQSGRKCPDWSEMSRQWSQIHTSTRLVWTGTRRLATEYPGVEKLPDYLRSDTRDVKKSTFLDNGHYMLSNGHY